MISEISFIRDYTSFWRTISPLSESFVKHINVQVLDRYEHELESPAGTSRRAIINEVGFELFCNNFEKNLSLKELVSNNINEISSKATRYISSLRSKAPSFDSKLNIDEIEEAIEIAQRLIQFFKRFQKVIIRPLFPGCGGLNSCYGDVFADNILFEVKSGERAFRSIDLRQLALYLTLGRMSKNYTISYLSLYNPRKGFYFTALVNEFSNHFSGLSTEELCHRIEYALISDGLTRSEEII